MAIQSVMVSVDGSRFAETAVPIAARLARRARARLTLVMAHEPAAVAVAAGDAGWADHDEESVRAGEKAYLADVALPLGSVGGGPAEFRLIEGFPGPALAALLEEARPDLFVLSTHGRGAISRVWLGSVADYVIRHTTRPVLLVRPQPGDPIPVADVPFRRGLVLLDRATPSEAILGPVSAFAAITQAHLTLMHVAEPVLGVTSSYGGIPRPMPDRALDVASREAQRYLDGVADRLRDHGVQVATRVVCGVGAAATILQQLEGGRYDFVAMTTHGATGFRKPLLGRVADKVIRGAEVPVLLVRPDPEAMFV